jgi:hypothetical protein
MSGVSTFAIFRQLLQQSVDGNSQLDSSTRASMTTYIAALSKEENVELTFADVESTGGSVTVDEALKAVQVATGVLGTNRVVFDEITWTVEHTVNGTKGEIGALVGHGGNSPDALIATADISLQYRLSSTGTWKAFDRQTVLNGVTTIQFAADIADQVADGTLPTLLIAASQE